MTTDPSCDMPLLALLLSVYYRTSLAASASRSGFGLYWGTTQANTIHHLCYTQAGVILVSTPQEA